MDYLGLLRQLGQHLALEAAQHKGGDDCSQLSQVHRIAGRLAKSLLEASLAAEQPGVDEVEQAPQFAKVVLHRRAAQGEPKIPRQREQRLGPHRAGILDLLRLVRHQGGPMLRRQRRMRR
ncbi:hypothetical protein D3C87_1358120 [compost metagenome]